MATVNAVPLALWFSITVISNTEPYKMPFGPQPFNSINWYSVVNMFVAEM